MSDNLLNIEQTAQLLNVSKDTVRRRIKAGEIQAEKMQSPYGEQWFVPEDQFSQAHMIEEVVPMTRNVSVGDLQLAMQRAIADAVTTQTQELSDRLGQMEARLDGHYKLVDERLRTLMEQGQKKQTFWKRLFE